MSIPITPEWEELQIALRGQNLLAYCRKDLTRDECDAFVRDHLESAASAGSALLRHFCPGDLGEQVVNPGGIIGFKPGPPQIELWYLPKCSFEMSLDILDLFGFPDPHICENPERTRKMAKDLLLDIAAHRMLSLVTIGSEFIVVEQTGPGEPLNTDDMRRVLEFNQQHLGAVYGQGWKRSLRSHYRRKGFFVLGHE